MKKRTQRSFGFGVVLKVRTTVTVEAVFWKMARLLLLADSNFKNNIQDYPGQRIRGLEVQSCQSRQAVISGIAGVEEGIVVIACLDMIASDVVKTTVGEADNAVEMYYNHLFHKIIDRVDETDGKVAFGVVAPLFWRSLSEEVKRSMNHVFKNMMKTSMNKIWLSGYVKDVWAGTDGVHLISGSANRYIKHVQDFFVKISIDSGFQCVELFNPGAEQDLASEVVDRSWAEDVGMEQESVGGNPLGPPEEVITPSRVNTTLSPSILRTPTVSFEPSAGGLDSTQRRLVRLAAQLPDLSIPPPAPVQNLSEINGCFAKIDRRLGSLESKSYYSNLMMATLKEEQDTEANKAFLNRVTISGVEIPNITNMADAERVKAMRQKVGEVIDALKEPGQVFEVQFVRHLNKQVRGQKYSVIEVKFSDAKQAKDLRAAFVKKRKSLSDKVNITPVVRLSTRVRIEIMHSVCEVMKRKDPTITRANCLQFVPKPVIKVTQKLQSGVEASKTITFIEAVCWVKENGCESSIDLQKARERAGAKYKGMMAQHFVLME